MWPGMIPAGSVSHVLSTTMDYLPTITALAGVTLPTDRTYLLRATCHSESAIYPLIVGPFLTDSLYGAGTTVWTSPPCSFTARRLIIPISSSALAVSPSVGTYRGGSRAVGSSPGRTAARCFKRCGPSATQQCSWWVIWAPAAAAQPQATPTLHTTPYAEQAIWSLRQ